MTYKERLDFLFNGEPKEHELTNKLVYDKLLNNPNRHNKKVVMKLCILKLKDNSHKKTKHFTIKENYIIY